MDLIYYFYRMTAGYNNFFKGLKWPVLLAVSLLANNVVAQVIVTPGTAASGSLCVGDDYVDVGDIEVVENVPNALGNGTFTYILTPPTNFEFDPASGSVSVLQGDQLSNVSVTRGSTTFTIEYTHNDDGSTLDGFRIEGLKIKATGAGGPSLITANGGTSPARNGQDHGTFSSVQVVANAGDDVSICEGNSTVVGGTPAATGGDGNYTYLWTPTPELSDATAPNPTATPAASVTYTLTVTDGTGCSGADQVDITVNPKPVITVQPANAEICEGGDAVFTVTATGTNLAYQWYDEGNPVGGNSNELTLSSVGLADNGSNIHVVVTETGADPNCQVSSSTAVLTVYDTPTVSNAGADITQCNTGVFTMGATAPTVGTGTWSEVGGPTAGLVITNVNSATTTVTGLTAGNTVTLRWTISNGACTASTDDVVLSNEVQPVAEAGPGGGQCGIGPTNLFSLGATAAIGTGTWSKTSGDGIVTFSNVNDESATVWVDTEGSYTLAWTDVNGLCSDSDEVTINFYDTPTASNAGPDITQCNTEVFTMAANVPVVGSGTWSEVGGPTAGLVITNVNSATTTVTGLAAGSSANLRWTISNGACTASTDDVVLSNEVQPVAEAGPGGDVV
jgi:hypothetical protein